MGCGLVGWIEQRFPVGDRDWFLAVDSGIEGQVAREAQSVSKPVVVKTWPGLRGDHFRTF